MATVLSPPEQRVVLRNISWETYERLLTENADCSNPRLTYDRGVLEIMSPCAEHEELSHQSQETEFVGMISALPLCRL